MARVLDVERTVRRIIVEELELPDSVGVDTDFRKLIGVESIRILRAVIHIEKEFGVDLEDEMVFEADTIADLSRLVVSLSANAEPER